MDVSGIENVARQARQDATAGDAMRGVDASDFLDLLITELQNQDPMEPMDSQQMVEQLSQIRAIESNTRLTDTLESVRLGQNMATAAGLIGREVVAMDAKGEEVVGRVERVTLADGTPTLHVGEHAVDLKNVSEILDNSALASGQ